MFKMKKILESPAYGDKQLTMYWDEGLAEYGYALEVYGYTYPNFIPLTPPDPTKELPPKEYSWKTIASGDKEWAERTAKHYNIKMPVEKKNKKK